MFFFCIISLARSQSLPMSFFLVDFMPSHCNSLLLFHFFLFWMLLDMTMKYKNGKIKMLFFRRLLLLAKPMSVMLHHVRSFLWPIREITFIWFPVCVRMLFLLCFTSSTSFLHSWKAFCGVCVCVYVRFRFVYCVHYVLQSFVSFGLWFFFVVSFGVNVLCFVSARFGICRIDCTARVFLSFKWQPKTPAHTTKEHEENRGKHPTRKKNKRKMRKKT